MWAGVLYARTAVRHCSMLEMTWGKVRVLIVLLTRDRPGPFRRQARNIQSWLHSFPGVAVQVIDNSKVNSYASAVSSFPVVRTGGNMSYAEVSNAAIEYALECADWLVIAHDDDILHPSILSLVYSWNHKDEVSLITGRRIFQGFASTEEQQYYDATAKALGVPSAIPISGVELIAGMIDFDNIIPSSASAIRLKFLSQALRFSELWNPVADYHFWKEFINGTEVVHAADLVLTYGLDGDRISTEPNASLRISALKCLSDCHSITHVPEIESHERLCEMTQRIESLLDPSRALDDSLVERLLDYGQILNSRLRSQYGG